MLSSFSYNAARKRERREEEGDDFLLLFQKLFQQKGRARRKRERIKECSRGGMEEGMSPSSSIGNTARKNELEADEKEFAFNDVWEVAQRRQV